VPYKTTIQIEKSFAIAQCTLYMLKFMPVP
jgi:hypothetical protein